MGLHIGEDIGDYRVVSIIGAGSIGQVFQVEHRITKRKEALKVLSGDFSTESQVRRFEREIETQARLDHPHIARVHNALHSNGSLMLVMELVEGESLERKLRNGRVSRSAGIDYIRQTLAALEYAHHHGVVHRDVTPANLIIDQNGHVKLTDFGVAKSLGDYQLTNAGEIIGSLHYMPPEQVRRHSDPDPRSDIYSTGAVLYEILAGKTIYDCPDRLSLMVAQVQQAPKPLLEIDPTIGPELNAVVLKALAKDPAERYQSAAEFLAVLDSLGRAPISKPVARRRFLSRIPVGSLALTAFAFTYQGNLDRSVPPAPVVRAAAMLPDTKATEVPKPDQRRLQPRRTEVPTIALPAVSQSVEVIAPLKEPVAAAEAPAAEIASPPVVAAETVPDPQPHHKGFWNKLNPFRRKKADPDVRNSFTK